MGHNKTLQLYSEVITEKIIITPPLETCILKLAKTIPIRSGKIQSYILHDYNSIHTITWINLQRIVLVEKKSQSPKIAYCMILEMANYRNGGQIARG